MREQVNLNEAFESRVNPPSWWRRWWLRFRRGIQRYWQYFRNYLRTLFDRVQVIGHTRITVEYPDGTVREVLDEQNALQSPLKGYLQDSLNSNIDRAIDDLFTSDEATSSSGAGGTDGILVHDADASEILSTDTDPMSKEYTFGRKWKGVIESTKDGRSIDQAILSHDYFGSNRTDYALQDFTAETLDTGYKMTLEWEVYIQ